jgi:hypothetical protein
LALKVRFSLTHHEEEDSSDGDTFVAFERDRRVALAQYVNPTYKFVEIRLKSDQPSRTPSDAAPQFLTNPRYLDHLSKREAFSAPLEDSSPKHLTLSGQFHSSSDVSPRSTRRPRRPATSEEGNLSVAANASWIHAAALDADDEIPGFLSTLPEASLHHRKSERRSKPAGALIDDPVEEAWRSAMSQNKQVQEEPEPPARPQNRNYTADELTREWGFTDPEIGRHIKRFMKSMTG